MTARMAAAMNAGAPLALLCFIDHPDGEVRVWSHTGTLDYDGHEWTGLGQLGRVSGITKSSGLAIKQVSFELAGVPPTSDNLLSSRVRNRDAYLWLAALTRARKVIADPYLLVWARLDYQSIKVDDNLNSVISMVGDIGFWSIERSVNLAWSHEQQQVAYAGDSGLSLIPSLANKESNWRLTA